MSQKINHIKNPSFDSGKSLPTGWLWEPDGRSIRWDRGDGSEGVRLISESQRESGLWSQVLVCKPGDFYRAEATVTCDLEAGDHLAGLILRVEPTEFVKPGGRRTTVAKGRVLKPAVRSDRRGGKDGGHGPPCVTPALHRVSRPSTLRAYYHAPADIRRITLSVGIVRARGAATIQHVRFIRILEPDEESHMLAIPPPAVAEPVAKIVKTIAICSVAATERPLTQILSKCLGGRNVHPLNPQEFRNGREKFDAVLFLDAEPPPLRSLAALFKLAENQLVVISLAAFNKIAGGKLPFRTIDQPDDPIHAKVVYANHATRGFALQDVFAFAAHGKEAHSFRQDQFRNTPAFRDFCKKHGFVTLLTSMCDKDSTSDQPICLWRPGSGGGLYVLDLDPIEEAPTTFAESTLAMHFLLTIFGRAHVGLGQYVVPVQKETKLREQIREMNLRFDSWIVHEGDVPEAEVTQQLVTLGRDDQTFGLPLKTKPLILVRSGLVPGDAESVYGAFLWFKQLVRMPPHQCPYADVLGRHFRFAWLPLSAEWRQRDGWQRDRVQGSAAEPLALSLDDAHVAAVIDIVSMPANRLKVVFPRQGHGYDHTLRWLPRVFDAFKPAPSFVWSVDYGGRFANLDGADWRWLTPSLEFSMDSALGQDALTRQVEAADGIVLRLEVPGNDADFPAQSIVRTNWIATLLEQVIGLQYGIIAVNRGPGPVVLDGFAPVGIGEALIMARDQVSREKFTSRAV